MTREMNNEIWQAKKWHNEMESKLSAAVYANCEYDCSLCAESPNLCPYCEGNTKPRVLNPDIAEFFERCCNMERLK